MLNRRRSILAACLALGLAVLACEPPSSGPSAETIVALTVEARPTLTVTPPAAATTQAPPQLPTFTPVTPATATFTSQPPSITPVQAPCDRAAFVTDVTVPDGSDFHAGDTLTKTWRLRNNGTCTWTSGYSLIFDHGDAMGAPASQQLTTGTVAPGQSIDVSVNLTAPGSVGTYRGYFLLRNPSGAVFGIGANADVAFWVEIEVVPLVLEIVPFPVVTAFFIFHSSGSDVTVADEQCFDLDAGNTISCGNAGADFQYEAFLLNHEYDPVQSASVGGSHGAAPSRTVCSTGGITTATIDLDEGPYYCYRTGEGRWGWLHPSDLDSTDMTFGFATYQ